MKVIRETVLETDRPEIGDRITVHFGNEQHTARAVYHIPAQEATLFVLETIVEEMEMNEKGTNKGGWEASGLRKYMNTDLLAAMDEETRARMVPFTNGDMLTIPCITWIFGDDDFCDEDTDLLGIGEQIPFFRDEKNRVASYEMETAWYWLRDPVSAALFANVASSGHAHALDASAAYGIRPAFLISDLPSPPPAGGEAQDG